MVQLVVAPSRFLIHRRFVYLNLHVAPTDHLGMDSQDKRNRVLRQKVVTILLTALLGLIQAGYLYLYDVPFPDQRPVPETLHAEHTRAHGTVVTLDH